MVFYFSGTGNTQWAAEELARTIGETLINISEAQNGESKFRPEHNERIGFCFPVHGWRPPVNVRCFIEKLRIEKSERHYCYAICTAGDTVGETMDYLQNDLQKSGLQLDAAWSLIMPESYVGLPFMDVDTPAKEQEKKEQAARDLQKIIPHIINRDREIFRLTRGHWPRINSRLIGSFFLNHLITDKYFRVESKRCVKCGICADVCPTDDITGGLGQKPVWKHTGNCLTCFSCYHHCPHHAIEFGRMTKNKGQYWFNRRAIR